MDAFRGRPILIIEDDPGLREVLQIELELEGFTVVVARHGLEALEQLGRMERPGVILLDLMMPVMNGWEFLVRLRATEAYAAIPVIVLSAFDDREKPAEADAFLRKPVDLRVLLDAIGRHGAASLVGG